MRHLAFFAFVLFAAIAASALPVPVSVSWKPGTRPKDPELADVAKTCVQKFCKESPAAAGAEHAQISGHFHKAKYDKTPHLTTKLTDADGMIIDGWNPGNKYDPSTLRPGIIPGRFHITEDGKMTPHEAQEYQSKGGQI